MEYLNIIFQEIYKILFLLIPVLVSVAMIVWLDRRVWAFVQKRQGPNVVGPFGLLQSLADALKYIFKEIIIPASSNKVIFILAPIVTMTLALIAWAVIPFSETQVLANINVGILYLFAVSSLGVYGIIMGGWASNSKYPFLGAIRSAAQMVSYEVSIGIIIINVLLCVGSLNLNDIVLAQQNLWFIVPLFPMFVIFFISALAETNRPPFDLPEAEAELVAGYQTEYSGMMYAMFWLGEYANILLMCALGSILFLGGWLSPIDLYPFNIIPGAIWLIFKILLLFILFALVKATVPRYRYDQLMRLGWKIFLPLSLIYVVLTASFLMYFDLLPGKLKVPPQDIQILSPQRPGEVGVLRLNDLIQHRLTGRTKPIFKKKSGNHEVTFYIGDKVKTGRAFMEAVRAGKLPGVKDTGRKQGRGRVYVWSGGQGLEDV